MEDDAGLARLLQKNLARSGYVVDLARNGEEGLRLYAANAYDVIVVDYMMPVYDGLEVIRQLAARGPLPPLIMLTAHGDEAIAVEAMKLGAGDYLVKDIEAGYLQLLPSVIERLLEQRRLIESKRQALEALRESEERFRKVFEDAPIGMGIIGLDFRLVKVNKSLCQMLGYSEQELTAVTFVDITHPDDVEKDVAQAVRLFKGEIPSYQLEKRFLTNNQDVVWVDLTATVLRDHTGKPVYGVGMVENISERKRGQDALLAAARLEATSTLAGGIAHHFNNLMFVVLGNVELLQMKLADQPEAMDRLGKIFQSAQRASELVRQMLAFARAGKYQPLVMNLNDTVQETLRLQARSLPTRIQVERDLEPSLWDIEADPTQMTQIVMNLCLNAVEAIQDGGHIAITTANVVVDDLFAARHPGLTPGRYISLSVADNGSGMSAETQARLFEPFFTTKALGRGLGLAAVYGIVKNHQGHIVVSSKQGRGSTFQIYLPATTAVSARPFTPAETAPRGSETILLIDDEQMVLAVIREILEQLGYRVLVAASGQEAVTLARTYDGEIELALLDMGMPGMSGLETYPLLKNARPQMKVIVCSGYDLDASVQTLLEAGASSFIGKPFQVTTLAVEIRKALDN
jgi:PAS domain S-box-containing protein